MHSTDLVLVLVMLYIEEKMTTHLAPMIFLTDLSITPGFSEVRLNTSVRYGFIHIDLTSSQIILDLLIENLNNSHYLLWYFKVELLF